ncbi:hypothetical protein ACFUCV_01305 [Specibacter sp. NPDC057265]|uniref:hypothetical protein n=1 Tax=Specibacter sp. NPDC057265 TaxID=3346075 RepID=UPI0036445970
MVDVVRIGLLGPIVQTVAYLPLWALDAPVEAYFYVPGTAYFAMAVAGYVVASRRSGIKLYFWGTAPFRRVVTQHRLWHTAAPFLIVSVGMAAGFQSHRLLLAQFGTPTDVAEYSLVAQFLGPLLAVTSVVGQNLWTRYRSMIGTKSLEISVFRSHILIFLIIGLVFYGVLFLVMPVASNLLTAGAIYPSVLVIVFAGLYLLVSAIHQPSAMLLNDTKGLWFQAACVIMVAVGTIVLTILTVDRLGAAAPYASMVVSMVLFQLFPSLRLAMLIIRRQNKA